MTEIFGNKTVYIRSRRIAFRLPDFSTSILASRVFWLGFGLPDDNLHAPNEKLYLPNFYRGIDAIVRYLEKLG